MGRVMAELTAADAIATRREGQGPEILLVHGGAPPERTWAALRPMTSRWTLVTAYRRGYPPSPPPAGPRPDFDDDAADLFSLLGSRPHLVAHSYGNLGALLAAGHKPDRVRSLTLIEPPLYYLVPDDPQVARLRQLGNAVLGKGLDADPEMLREFLRVAGNQDVDDGPLPQSAIRAVRRAHGKRPPDDARPRLDLIRSHHIPTLVASGGHSEAIERICDALANELSAERIVVHGAGHFVADAPTFSAQLERFLATAPASQREEE
jgi:pimeloyl-ACP methyl ester carboxylesterase